MKTASSKAKGRKRKCRRCTEDYELSFSGQKVCLSCRSRCSGCNIELTEENQDKRSRESGKNFRCRSCVSKGVRDIPGRKEWQKNYDLKRHYGLSLEDFEAMSRSGCQVCHSTAKLVVDHCHDTGVVRGVLCSTCNSGFGMFKDNLELLKGAVNYMERHFENR